MNKYKLGIIGIFLTAMLVVGQNLPRTLPAVNSRGYYGGVRQLPQAVRRNSLFNGKEYVSILQQPTVSREWETSVALPISLPAAEKEARVELSKIVPDDSEWVVTDFQISRFGAGPIWYYAVTLQPTVQLSDGPAESFTALIDFSGTPGRVVQLGPHQVRR
jgi:hypothetical protein